MLEFDVVIIGGGIFGAYTALFLAEKNYKIGLIEKEAGLFSKASLVNQGRLHGGYHYPRSFSTARMAQDYKERFTADHKQFINSRFENYYAIDKTSTLTSKGQFEHFCKSVGIEAREVKQHPLFNMELMESLYLTEEFSFDPAEIAAFYKEKLGNQKNISILLNSKIVQAEKDRHKWVVEFVTNGSPEFKKIKTSAVINATYAGTNAINSIFDVPDLDLMYEIAEIVRVESPVLRNTGLTVIDGPFASFIPYGNSGQISLTSVIYTHHKASYSRLPEFDCQQVNADCRPGFVSNCSPCAARPVSNQEKMVRQIKQYLNPDISMHYIDSMFTLKAKLKSSFVDDARPTEIVKLGDHPSFYCLFSGKINSIYEIEKLLGREF
jgi:hypothetical protein